LLFARTSFLACYNFSTSEWTRPGLYLGLGLGE
jgi:hypothetical protein